MNNIEGYSGSSYTKIFSVVNKFKDDQSIVSRSGRFNIEFKDSVQYYDNITKMADEDYALAAGSNISNLFAPFQSKVNVSGGMPGFASGVPITVQLPSGQAPNIHMLLPFEWDKTASGVVYDRHMKPSGDSLNGLLTAEKFYADIDQYRDISDIRGIGLRLPLVGVGWGYCTADNHPWPSGKRPANAPSGATYFKGPNGTATQKGWQVDPADYIAAPIDLRYDRERHVWTTLGRIEGYKQYSVLMITDTKQPGSQKFEYPRFYS